VQEFSEKVLVLHVGRFREADAWVRLFSPSRGLFTAFAFGGCRSRRRFCGCLDPLNEVLFRVKGNKLGTYLCLEEGVLVRSWQRLRKEPRLLGLAVNCIKFTEALISQPDSCHQAYELLARTLDLLDDGDLEAVPGNGEFAASVPALFRATLAFSQGYAPRLDACADCGAAGQLQGASFLVEQGQLLCHRCAPGNRGLHLPVSSLALAAMQRLEHCAPEQWAELRLPTPAFRELAVIVDYYVRFHLGLAWDRGRFRQV
jgi:DNA repair protein RecO (recombination protein O)